MSTPAKIDDFIQKYVELRDLKAQMKKAYEESVAPVQAALDKIETHLLAKMSEQGCNALKTDAGTAYVSEKTSVTMADWEAYIAFVQQRGLWNMLNHAANKTAVQEYIDANDEMPPGVNLHVEKTVGVRRA